MSTSGSAPPDRSASLTALSAAAAAARMSSYRYNDVMGGEDGEANTAGSGNVRESTVEVGDEDEEAAAVVVVVTVVPVVRTAKMEGSSTLH